MASRRAFSGAPDLAGGDLRDVLEQLEPGLAEQLGAGQRQDQAQAMLSMLLQQLGQVGAPQKRQPTPNVTTDERYRLD